MGARRVFPGCRRSRPSFFCNMESRRGASSCWATWPNKFCGWRASSGGEGARFPGTDSPAAGASSGRVQREIRVWEQKGTNSHENHRQLYRQLRALRHPGRHHEDRRQGRRRHPRGVLRRREARPGALPRGGPAAADRQDL